MCSTTVLVFVFAVLSLHRSHVLGKLPEEDLLVPELVRYWDYPIEVHETKTQDGYFLTLHRIPHGRKSHHTYDPPHEEAHNGDRRPVVFLQHGLLCSSSNWVTNLPNNSLGFMLAEAGYDVWMGNVRGNTYSRRHETWSVKDKRFWDFSFDEMARFDLEAMLMYTLEVTREKSLYYVGHSQGTMIMFAGLSSSKVLQQRIKMAFALAPVTRIRHLYSPIRYLAPFEIEMKVAFDVLGIYDFLPSNKAIRTLADKMCPIDEKICSTILFLIAGYDKKDLNMTRIPVYFTHTPAGTSVKNMYHFSQLVGSGLFRMFDYGRLENLVRYHSMEPPEYNIQNINTPIRMMSGSNDWLATPDDVKWTAGQLPGLLEVFEVDGYNHLDFVWGMSAGQRVYRKIIKDILAFEEKSHEGRLVL